MSCRSFVYKTADFASKLKLTWIENVVPETKKEEITWMQNVVPEIEKEEIINEHISDADHSYTTSSLTLSNQGALYHKRAKFCCVIGFPSYLREPSDAIRLICEENYIDQPVNVWYYTHNSNQGKVYGLIEFDNQKHSDRFLQQCIRDEMHVNEAHHYVELPSDSDRYGGTSIDADVVDKSSNQQLQQNRDAQLMAELMKCESLTQQIELHHNFMTMNDMECLLRYYSANSLETTLKHSQTECLQDCLVFPSGSSINGNGSHYSDLDTVIVYPQLETHMKEKKVTEKTIKKRILLDTCRVMKSVISPPGIDVSEQITNASEPLVCLRSHYTNTAIDVTVASTKGADSLLMGRILHLLGLIDKRYLMLSLTVKHWAIQHGLVQSGPTPLPNAFCFNLLLLFYLQQLDNPVMPPLDTIISYIDEGKSDQDICDLVKPELQNQRSTEILFYQFLKFYEDYNFNRRLSVNKGSTVGRVYYVESLQMMYPLVSTKNVFKAVRSDTFCDQLRTQCKATVKKIGSVTPNTKIPWGLCLLFE